MDALLGEQTREHADLDSAIDGTDVRCESAKWAVRWRTGYPPRPNDLHDVPLLCARFGIPLPAGF